MAITRYSVDDYEEMVRLGVLTENDRVELIRGEIVAKMPIGPGHAGCVNRSNRLFTRVLGQAAIVASHLEAVNHCMLSRADLRAWLDGQGLRARVSVPEDGEACTFHRADAGSR